MIKKNDVRAHQCGLSVRWQAMQSTHQSCANVDRRKQEMRGQVIRKTREEDSVGAEEKEMKDEVADLNLFIFYNIDYLM